MILLYHNNYNRKEDQIKQILIYFYGCTASLWFSLILLQFNWESYNYICSFYFSFTLLWVILFYHYIFYMTSVEKDERFQKIVYIVPVLFFLFLLVYPFFVPLNIRFQNFNDQIIIDSTYSSSSFLIYVLAIFRRVFMAVYGILCYRRLKKLELETGNKSRLNKWLWSVLWIYWIIFLFIMLRLFDYDSLWLPTIYTIMITVSFVVLQTIICFNMLSENYKLNTTDGTESDSVKRKYTIFQKTRYKSYRKKKKKMCIVINRMEFENYFRLKKPYLDPKFRLDDLVDTFNACRSVISTFVNKTYGMSFSWYVNSWRLDEIEKLMNIKSNNNKVSEKLVLKAGFGSYRNYMRVKSYFMNNKKVNKCT